MLAFENVNRLLKGRQKFLNDFESKIFPIGNQKHGKRRPSMLASRPLDLARLAKVSDQYACESINS